MSTSTATPAQISISQTKSILRQLKHMFSPAEWNNYISALHFSLTQGQLVDTHTSAPAVVQLFQQMLAQELNADMPRTLPSSLAATYPWASMDMPVIEHYMRFANRRDNVKGHGKDVEAARNEAMRICVTVLGDESGRKSEEGLIHQLTGLKIQGHDSHEEVLSEQFGGLRL
ncbi:hypothetical protein BDU57DRAFT_533507 [Ampelomyces quisqualis]|uniref:Uncharacterized protein n=1 Tax=Ampelomyces quisqualis TaxID=50730 RepID=A0A6A5QA54_AMPQU|nr:hypothetical protein BDU57DRAFT_533507 [Ampelomyces quisqualis]